MPPAVNPAEIAFDLALIANGGVAAEGRVLQVGDQRVHLLLSKAAGEGGHHSLAGKNHPTHLDIGCRSAAGESCPAKDCVQVRWRLLKRQVVLLVTVGAAAEVQVLPCYLLPG